MWRETELNGRVVAVVVGLVALAVVLESILDPLLGGSNFLISSLAVGMAALYGGMSAGVLATVLGAIGVVMTQFEPLGQLDIGLASEVLQVVVFVAVGVVFSYLAGRQHRALTGEIAARHQVDASAQRTEILNHVLRGLLQTPLDVASRAETVTESFVPRLADAGALLLWDHDRLVVGSVASRGGGLQRAVMAGVGGPGPGPVGACRVSRNGVAEWGTLPAAGPVSEHLAAWRDAGVTAYALVPVPTGVGPPDVLVLVRGGDAPAFDADEQALVQTIALAAGTAMGNALLYHDARRAIEARDRLSAAVSHDLKNPLNVILLSVDLLQRSAVDPALTYVREVARSIQRSAERMNLLVRDMLDLSRLEHGRLGLSLAALDPLAIAREAVALVQPLALQKSQSLQVLPPQADLPPVRADRDRLLQVFSNLLGNAIAYTPEGGAITVSLEAGGGEVTVAVSDTGPGIAAEQLPHLFDRYWRGRTGQHGTGLGLSIAKGIVEAHEGRIWVESRAGGGSTFRFTLPALPRRAEAA